MNQNDFLEVHNWLFRALKLAQKFLRLPDFDQVSVPHALLDLVKSVVIKALCLEIT